MQTNYVLIDFENVQPKKLEILAHHNFKVFLFVGANQTKVSFDLAQAMQELGENASYIRISGNGPNATANARALGAGDLKWAAFVGSVNAGEECEDPGTTRHPAGEDPCGSWLSLWRQTTSHPDSPPR